MRTEEVASAKSEYLAFCKQSRSLSHNTLLAYEQDLICFNRYYELQTDQTELNQNVVLSYLRFLRERRNLQPATVRRRILTLRAFTAWLEKSQRIAVSPFSGLDLELKLPRRLPRPVDRSIVLGLLACRKDSTTTLAIKLMIATGVRVGELTHIRISDIFDDGR